MTRVVTEREIKGWTPTKIYMHTVSKHVKKVCCLYIFAGDVPEEFVEAERCQS